ncbi:response regulator [Methanobacterium sp. BAmetb5]|uniref:response regulator n=1 Tax=Methanobacterium sp. BAmetb5 TaxID=2025351 RepID=UPI000E9E8634|nr:response regulator [Methanobacterium sp. BAmetb5]AXV39380.1 MAG: histidine kinase [Methanobacterium sp. BAmetb5]
MKPASVLIVEDEMVTALDLKAKLVNIGFTVPSIVNSGEEAVDMAAELRPDVVLMDIVLQGEVDGIQAAKKISSLDIPVVFLTAYSDEKTLQRAKSTSPYGYIIKPYPDKDLELALETAIHKHQEYRDKIELIRYKGLGKGVPLTNQDDEISWEERPRILIVEDEIITAMDLTAQLSDKGYLVVDTVTNGQEAIHKAELFRPDLVLMDIVLSGELDGISVAEHIHDLDIPVVFLSAYTDDTTVERAIKTSPYGYLPKPYQIDELYSTLETVLQQHRSETDRIKKIDQKITTKEGEMVIEKTAVFFISAIVLSLIVYSLATRSMTWLMYLLFIPAIYNLFIVGISLKKPSPPEGKDQPFVSILIPAHNEEFTIERCIRSLAELDYYADGKRNYEIIVINDGSTDKTGEVLARLKVEFEYLRIVTRKPPRAGRGKGYVLNDGVRICQGEVIAVFDADARIDPDFLGKIIPYLDEENVAGVQARVRMYNADRNLLTMMQEVEFSIFGNVILRARDIMGKSGFLGGNGQLTRKKFVEDIEGWDGFAVTEDLNMSVKLIIDGNKIRYCPEAVVWQEAVPEWKAFFRQRVRWATGNLETLFVYLTPIIDAKIPLYKKVDSIQYLVFLLFTVFVMLGYVVAILSLTQVARFSMEAPVIIGLISTVAFFPGVLLGIRRDKVGVLRSLVRAVEYWAYCLYLIPLFFAAFIHMLTRKERRWAKTKHTGD